MAEKFDVWQFFPEGYNEQIGFDLEAQAAVDLALDFTRRPAAMIGIIQEVRIVDKLDNLVFHWKFGEGVVFPKPEDMEKYE